MNAIRCLLLVTAILLETTVFAAPNSLAGFVYVEHGRLVPSGPFHRREIHLAADGRFTPLVLQVDEESVKLISEISIPSGGTWSYRKLSETAGELTLGDQTLSLTFTSELEGTRPSNERPTPVQLSNFSLRPYSASRVANVSNRTFVRAGGAALSGFIIENNVRYAIVRVVGPSLAAFGVEGTLRAPALRLLKGPNPVLIDRASAADMATFQQRAGAFPLVANSGEPVHFYALPPGSYVAEATSSDATASGEALIEVYFLP